MSVTSQAAPLVDPRPTNRRPPLQRPTPSRCIRLHLDTHDQLAKLKRGGESFTELVQRLMYSLAAAELRERIRQASKEAT